MPGLGILNLEQKSARELLIKWTDNRDDIYDVVLLRRNCPCAVCIDEWSGEKKLKPEDIKDSTRPVRIETVGSYALKFHFNDGHSTGIYTYSLLRDLAN